MRRSGSVIPFDQSHDSDHELRSQSDIARRGQAENRYWTPPEDTAAQGTESAAELLFGRYPCPWLGDA